MPVALDTQPTLTLPSGLPYVFIHPSSHFPNCPLPNPDPNPSLQMSRDRPVGRCAECGNVLKMEYVGPQEDAHDHHGDGHHKYEEPKTFADFVRPEYR